MTPGGRSSPALQLLDLVVEDVLDDVYLLVEWYEDLGDLFVDPFIVGNGDFVPAVQGDRGKELFGDLLPFGDHHLAVFPFYLDRSGLPDKELFQLADGGVPDDADFVLLRPCAASLPRPFR